MDYSDSILGSTTTNVLRARGKAALLVIGSDTFTRRDLAATDCFSFAAAANLSKILNHALHVKNTRDLFERIAPSELALPRLGSFSIAVLGAAFEKKDLGGANPLVAWVTKHLAESQKVTTFVSLKKRDQTEEAKERKATKARKAARRDQAHRTRKERFAERSTPEGAAAP